MRGNGALGPWSDGLLAQNVSLVNLPLESIPSNDLNDLNELNDGTPQGEKGSGVILRHLGSTAKMERRN